MTPTMNPGCGAEGAANHLPAAAQAVGVQSVSVFFTLADQRTAQVDRATF
ncbi:MAG: hypothetical protein V5B34_00955 [Accumulibacter sp.]|jgi:uncharacterized lipoprotein YajG